MKYKITLWDLGMVFGLIVWLAIVVGGVWVTAHFVIKWW